MRLAVVGAGRMGRRHLQVLAEVAEVEVVAVVDTRPEVLAALDDVAPGIRRAEAMEEVLTDVEAILVAASTPAHPVLTAAALEAGRHLLVEKPLALDPAVARRLGDEASRRELVLQVGFWRRFSPPWRVAWKMVRGGSIGRPVMLRFSQWDAAAPPPEFCDPEVSGGLAVDCGIHEFDLAQWLTGDAVTAVRAWGLPTVDPGVEAVGDLDGLVAVLELDGGAVATVDLSRHARYGDDVRTEILGSEGALFVDVLPAGRIRLGTASGMTEPTEGRCDDALAAGLAAQIRAFASAVRGRHVRLPGAEASARATEIALAVAEATRSGDRVEVAEMDG